jgi:hypothetical protein
MYRQLDSPFSDALPSPPFIGDGEVPCGMQRIAAILISGFALTPCSLITTTDFATVRKCAPCREWSFRIGPRPVLTSAPALAGWRFRFG